MLDQPLLEPAFLWFDESHGKHLLQLILIRPDESLSSLCRNSFLPDGLAGPLGFKQEPLNPISKDGALFIHSILQMTYQMGMTELMGSGRGVVLGTPTIVDEHTVIVLGKLL